jgi:hypothetical protein
MRPADKPFTTADDGAMRSKAWLRSLRQWGLVGAGVIIGISFIIAIVSRVEEVLITAAILSVIVLAVFARFRSLAFRFDDPLEIGHFWRKRRVPVDQVSRFEWEDRSESSNHRKVFVTLIGGEMEPIPALGQIGRANDPDARLATRVGADQTVVEMNRLLAEWRVANPGTLEA